MLVEVQRGCWSGVLVTVVECASLPHTATSLSSENTLLVHCCRLPPPPILCCYAICACHMRTNTPQQDEHDGGISDRPDDMADVYHTFFGIAGLSLMGYEGLQAIDPTWALPVETVQRLKARQPVAARQEQREEEQQGQQET